MNAPMDHAAILALRGRALDAAIAEHVDHLRVVAQDWPCGWEPDSCDYRAASWPEYEQLPDKGPVYVAEGGVWPPTPDPTAVAGFSDWGRYARVLPVPFYSTDYSPAMALFFEMLTRIGTANIRADMEDYAREPGHIIWVTIGDWTVLGDCRLAICQAALLVTFWPNGGSPDA